MGFLKQIIETLFHKTKEYKIPEKKDFSSDDSKKFLDEEHSKSTLETQLIKHEEEKNQLEKQVQKQAEWTRKEEEETVLEKERNPAAHYGNNASLPPPGEDTSATGVSASYHSQNKHQDKEGHQYTSNSQQSNYQ